MTDMSSSDHEDEREFLDWSEEILGQHLADEVEEVLRFRGSVRVSVRRDDDGPAREITDAVRRR